VVYAVGASDEDFRDVTTNGAPGADLTVDALNILAGNTLDMGTNDLAVDSGLITGGGTLHDAACTAGTKGDEGLIDGGDNTGIVFQRGKSGTACTTGTAA
jgi:hypothetical protein